MSIDNTDKILREILREFKDIRLELHALNRSIQYNAIMTSDLPNHEKVRLLKILGQEDMKEEIHE